MVDFVSLLWHGTGCLAVTLSAKVTCQGPHQYVGTLKGSLGTGSQHSEESTLEIISIFWPHNVIKLREREKERKKEKKQLKTVLIYLSIRSSNNIHCGLVMKKETKLYKIWRKVQWNADLMPMEGHARASKQSCHLRYLL